MRFYQLQSPMLNGLIPTEKLLSVEEAGSLATQEGTFHSYGFAFRLDGLPHDLYAAGFADLTDAVKERERMLDPEQHETEPSDYRVFEDLSLTGILHPLVVDALQRADRSGTPQYILHEGGEHFRPVNETPTGRGQSYLTVHPNGSMEATTILDLDPDEAQHLIDQGVREGKLRPTTSRSQPRLDLS